MGRFCQMVMGPAGSGKSTYCETFARHLETMKRQRSVMNMDPAIENMNYAPHIDIRDLITLEDVMDMLHLGPNGGLMYCLEYLLYEEEGIEWLEEQLAGDYNNDDYLLIDLPGQIELFTHSDLMKRFISVLESKFHYRVLCVYLLDSQFISDPNKFISGVLTATSAMIQLERPHLNILSKLDLIEGRPAHLTSGVDPTLPHEGLVSSFTEEEEEEREEKRKQANLDRFLSIDLEWVLTQPTFQVSSKYDRLRKSLVHLLNDYQMVSFLPLNVHDQSSLDVIMEQVDYILQFGEDQEPKEPKLDEQEVDADWQAYMEQS